MFQDRYKSEVVENDKYFLTVLRYIYQNPIKAKIVDSLTKYPWSGYNEYFGKNEVCDINFVLSLFSDDKKRAMKLFENSMLKKIPGKFRVMKKKEDTK